MPPSRCHPHLSFRGVRHRSRRSVIVAILLATTLSACRYSGPDIPRYEPRPHLAPVAIEVWSNEVWTAARTNDIASLDRLLATPPEPDPSLDAWRTRLAELDAAAATNRADECERLLDRLTTGSADSPEEAVALARLAEIRSIENSAPLIARIDPILEAGIHAWHERALTAGREGRIDDAIDAWTVLQRVAADGRHVELELVAMDRVSRLAHRRPGAGRRDPIPPDAVVDCLARTLLHHVDHPDWVELVQAGFIALEDAVRAMPADDRPVAAAVVQQVRDEFDPPPPNIPETGRRLRTMSPADRRTVDRLARSLANARDTGDLPETMADPIRVFLDGMLEATDVRTRAFLGGDAETIERLLGASFVGIGVRIEPHPGGLELHPLPGGPARRAGIRRGDMLTAIDGVEVDTLAPDEIVARATGRRGTGVELRIVRADTGESETVVVVRDDIELEAVHGWRQLDVDARGRPVWDWIVDADAAIAYVSIREFDRDTDRRFREAMRDADRALGSDRLVQGLILDLRENPGGDRQTTERLLDLFINQGDVFLALGDPPARTSTPARIETTRLAGLPVAVLVSDHSASASELVAGTLQGAADAVVVGERTFGKGSVQGVHPTPHGYLLVTEAWFMVPSSPTGAWRAIDRTRTADSGGWGGWGVMPTVPVAALPEEIDAALAERASWTSQRGRDTSERPSASARPDLAEVTDRGLLTAAVLLRARLQPGLVGANSTDAPTAPSPTQ